MPKGKRKPQAQERDGRAGYLTSSKESRKANASGRGKKKKGKSKKKKGK